MKRTGTITALALATALAGCQDAGLEGNIPLDEAENAPPSDLVAAVYAPGGAAEAQLVVDGRLWVPTGLPASLDAAGLRAVGSAGGRTVHARSWDRPPYDALFTRVSDETGHTAGAGPTSAARGDTTAAAAAGDTVDHTVGDTVGAADARPARAGASEERWQEWAPVHGRTGALPGPDAGDHGAGDADAHGPETDAGGH